MTPDLLENIFAQPRSLQQVAEYQFVAGRDALNRSAEALRGSRNIVLTGMGASLFACAPLAHMLAERGVTSSVVESSELLYFFSSTLDSDTAVVLVSRSGESVEVTRLLPILKERGCRSVGVFNVPDSTLARQAQEQLFLNCPPDELVAVQTYTATLLALALLGAAYSGEVESARDEVEKTIPLLERLIKQCFLQAAGWEGFTSGSAPVYFLGRGAALASVSEGELLMHEVAKMPGVGMSVPQFRHGPVEAVNPEFRAVVFGTQPATADLDLGLAMDLVRMGARVRWLGPDSGVRNLLPLCSWPDGIPSRFTSLLEAIPLQLLAYRLAQARGVPAGKFRYAPMVTLSEVGFSVQEDAK